MFYILNVQAFTGDTLFIGSCGRPDLIGAIGHSAEEMSERTYHSLKNKICTLPDDVKVSNVVVDSLCDDIIIMSAGVSCTWRWFSMW